VRKGGVFEPYERVPVWVGKEGCFRGRIEPKVRVEQISVGLEEVGFALVTLVNVKP
jgi:hypothetical protein